MDNNIEIGRQERQREIEANPCLRQEGNDIYSLSARECVPLSAQREMRGTWSAGLEDSNFVPEQPDADMAGELVWLDLEYREALRTGVIQSESMPPHGTFAVHFVGRRSRQRGEYGTYGLYPHVVVVDRIISVRRTGDYRPPM